MTYKDTLRFSYRPDLSCSRKIRINQSKLTVQDLKEGTPFSFSALFSIFPPSLLKKTFYYRNLRAAKDEILFRVFLSLLSFIYRAVSTSSPASYA